MHSKVNLILLIFIIFAVQEPYTQQLYSNTRVKQGMILQAFIYPATEVISSSFELLNTRGKVISSNLGFFYNSVEEIGTQNTSPYDIYEVNVTLLGIASNLESGLYSLHARVETERGTLRLQKRIRVLKSTFKEELIRLNDKMNDVITKPDPKKTEQANRRWQVIKSINLDDLYYANSLGYPLPKNLGRTTSSFGDIRTYVYINGKRTRSAHHGFDLAAPSQTPILSSSKGLVVLAENRIITGNTVIIAVLPGVYLQYQHLDSLSVAPNEWVNLGTELGKLGETGFATGPHLHQELIVNTIRVDVEKYYSQRLVDKSSILNIINNKIKRKGR